MMSGYEIHYKAGDTYYPLYNEIKEDILHVEAESADTAEMEFVRDNPYSEVVDVIECK